MDHISKYAELRRLLVDPMTRDRAMVPVEAPFGQVNDLKIAMLWERRCVCGEGGSGGSLSGMRVVSGLWRGKYMHSQSEADWSAICIYILSSTRCWTSYANLNMHSQCL